MPDGQQPMTLDEIAVALRNIDNHAEPIAAKHPAGSDIHALAYAIHRLVMCVADLAVHVQDGAP